MLDYHRQLRTIAQATVVVILLAVLSGCAKKPEVTGEVLDGFGRPLAEATVRVANTTFVATTDRNGRYAVGYVPGKVSVAISKEGYTSGELALDIATEAKYPAQSVTLYKIPVEEGVFAFGSSDYIPLRKANLSFNSKEFPFSWDKPLFQETYAVTGDFAALDATAEFAFLDNDKHPLQLFAVGTQGVILSRTKKWMETKDDARMLADKGIHIAPGLSLRRVALGPVRYAFVTMGASAQMGLGGIGSGGPAFGALGHPIAEPVYLFEVK